MHDSSSSAPEQETIARDFAVTFGAAMAESGMPPMASRAVALLMVSEEGALTAAELQEGLDAGQGTVSAAVNYLIRLGFVTRERVPRSRKDSYRFRDDAWQEVLRQRIAGIDDWIQGLESTAGRLPAASRARTRLDEAARFMRFVKKDSEQLLDRWRAHQREQS